MEDSDSLSINQIQDNSDDLGALEDTDVCVSCCESLEDSLLLTCLHSICRSCAAGQNSEQFKCPRCRSTSTIQSLTPDFLHCKDPPKPQPWDNTALVGEITTLMTDGRERIEACNDNINKLTSKLGELHEERETIKSKIDETYEVYRTLLERCREESLLRLENSHNDKELTTMDRLEDLNLSQAHLEHTITYVSRVMKEFPNTEALNILPMAKLQLEANMRSLSTISNKVESTASWKSEDQFQQLVRERFSRILNPSVSAENLVIPDLAQRHVIDSKPILSKDVLKVDQVYTDLLSPHGLDQGFVSPGEHLLSPISGDGHHLDPLLQQQQLVNSKQTLTSLQVPHFAGQPGSLSVPLGSPRGPSPRSHGAIGSNLSSPSHQVYSSVRGNSHPDLSYRGQTPPPYGRGHTPPLGRGLSPLPGRGHTPPHLQADQLPPANRTDYSLAQLAEKIQRSNSGPVQHNFTLADLISNVGESPRKEWEDPSGAAPSQAYSNLAALAKLDEKTSWGPVDPNLLLPELNRNPLSRSLTALTSGQLSPVPPSVSPILGGGLGVPGMDPRGASPISPIDSLMPPMGSLSVSPVPPARTNRAINVMQVRCKFGTLGPGKGQFNSPHGFCLGAEEEIVVADTNNHRIQIFEKNGTYRSEFGSPGKEEGQLWYPRKVAVMKSCGKFVICDRGNERSRMQIFTKHGHFVRKIGIRYIDIVAGLAITRNGHIVAVDSVTPTMFFISSETGELIKWFDCQDYMREPSDIAVSGSELFVCDFKGHTVVVFNENGIFQRRIGFENITNFPNGIDVSDAGDILIGDSHGNRFHVAVFGNDGNLLGEFECPHVKVSRCCGLKITSEGYVVTLAKNNHHVLVLNTLYIA